MKKPFTRTETEERLLLEEIRAFSESLRSALAHAPRAAASNRCGVSTAAPRLLLEDSLHRVKAFLVHKAWAHPQTPEATSEQAYALWLFSSYLAHHQCMTLPDADFDAFYEFFFWWYPRQCENSSEALTERLFGSLREMFAFLVAQGDLADDGAVRGFLALEDSAQRLLALYERLDTESPYFQDQFEALFGLQPE